ncbi:restriction endonuclease subunit S [Streptococcus infantarius]|uniref:restriction endonuclease subunit S n=2 Tax=Streptococcus infantarius TaxID=102684 RepID=UPI0023A91C1E|nr:restriction endonuclease subunit S [Streptococcus infantarius]
MKDTNKLNPEIRFSGFTDDWEQRKLSEVSDVRDGTHDSPPYLSQGHPFVTSKNVKDGYINYEGIQYISDEDFEAINKRSKVDVNDILMGMIGTIGNLALIRTEPDFAIKNVALIKDTKQISYLYLYHYLQSPSTEKQLLSGLDGGTQKFISLKNIRDLNVIMPAEAEQIKIGTFFESLKNLITLHQRKLNGLKNVKKAMLEKMFPKNGESVPEIRFSGFTDDWEQRKLGEVAKFINGRAYSQDELLNNGKYKVLRVGNFYTNDSWYYSDMELDDKYYAENGDLLYTWSATFGPHIWHGDKVIYHYHIWKINLSKSLEKTFALQLLERDKEKILADKNGSTMVHITKSGMENEKVLLPENIEEQQKIGEYFSNLDRLITLHQRKLDKLKTLKKAMLEKMFI